MTSLDLVEVAAAVAGVSTDDFLEQAINEVTNQPQIVISTVAVAEEQVSDEAVTEVKEPEIEKAPLTKIQQMIEDAYTAYRSAGGDMPPSVECQDIRLFSTHIEVELNGIKKAVSLSDFKEVLDGMMSVDQPSLPALKLPEGTYHLAQNGSTMQLSCYYPAATKTILYGNKKLTVPFPNTIISHQLKRRDRSWHVEKSVYMCTQKSVGALREKFIAGPSKDAETYVLPIPNMYETGNMCFGGNTMPMVFLENLRGLDYYYQVIFEAPFNNDLGIRALGLSDVSDWLHKWAEMKEFPYEKLRR